MIIDGAADLPLEEHDNKTCLELAHTPNMDSLALHSRAGMTKTVPDGMEPSSALACMSILGYDPCIYYRGRSAIEARALGIPLEKHEFYFRCNLVSVKDGKMVSYSSGNIPDSEAHELLKEIANKLGNSDVHFFQGTSYRHICKIRGIKNILEAVTTPPHDITGKSFYDYLPHGKGSRLLRDYVEKSRLILQSHPINLKRIAENKLPANMIWLFWGSGEIPEMPSFQQVFGVEASMTSGVDLLKGLAAMTNITVLAIKGVTDAFDNNYAAQMTGALESLKKQDLVIVHVEAP
ncbi:MAG: 2,3-bisphosphoglycerate-independent phosphoglycerate mutase, partial [Chloroflexi bacterium]|nr:2,3-bisphosphoglycerate-independent phosphoglycerate mutase [Chloroflexota bacterium]